jgi:hypothetical protein
MNFNEALDAIKKGKKIRRKRWLMTDMVYLVENKFNSIYHIEYRYLGGCRMYAASSEDMLAEDWEIAE